MRLLSSPLENPISYSSRLMRKVEENSSLSGNSNIVVFFGVATVTVPHLSLSLLMKTSSFSLPLRQSPVRVFCWCWSITLVGCFRAVRTGTCQQQEENHWSDVKKARGCTGGCKGVSGSALPAGAVRRERDRPPKAQPRSLPPPRGSRRGCGFFSAVPAARHLFVCAALRDSACCGLGVFLSAFRHGAVVAAAVVLPGRHRRQPLPLPLPLERLLPLLPGPGWARSGARRAAGR